MKKKIAIISLFIGLVAAYVWIMPARGQMDQLLQAQQQEMTNMQKSQDAQRQGLRNQLAQLQQNQQQEITAVSTQQQQQITALQTQLQQAQSQGANNIQLQQMRDNIAVVTLQNQQALAMIRMRHEIDTLGLTQRQQLMETQFSKDLEILQANHSVVRINNTQPIDRVALLTAQHKVAQLMMQAGQAINELQAQQNIERAQKQQAMNLANNDNSVALQQLRNSQNIAMMQLQNAPAAAIAQQQQQNADYDRNMQTAKQNFLAQQQQEISNLQTQLQNMKTQNSQNYNNLLAQQKREMDDLLAFLRNNPPPVPSRNVYSCTGANNSCALLGQTTDSLATCQQRVGKPCFEDQACGGQCGSTPPPAVPRYLYWCANSPTCSSNYTTDSLETCQQKTGKQCFESKSSCDSQCGGTPPPNPPVPPPSDGGMPFEPCGNGVCERNSTNGNEVQYSPVCVDCANEVEWQNLVKGGGYLLDKWSGRVLSDCQTIEVRYRWNCRSGLLPNGQTISCNRIKLEFSNVGTYVEGSASPLTPSHFENARPGQNNVIWETVNLEGSGVMYFRIKLPQKASNGPTGTGVNITVGNANAYDLNNGILFSRWGVAAGGFITDQIKCAPGSDGTAPGTIKAVGSMQADSACQTVNIQGTLTCELVPGASGSPSCKSAKIVMIGGAPGTEFVYSDPAITSNPQTGVAIADMGDFSGTRNFNIKVKIPKDPFLNKVTALALYFETSAGRRFLITNGIESDINTRQLPVNVQSCQGALQVQTLPPFYLRDTYNSYQARSKITSFGDYDLNSIYGFFDVFVKNLGITLPSHMSAQPLPPETYMGPAWTDLTYLSNKAWGVSIGDQLCYRAYVVPRGQDPNIKTNRVYSDASWDQCWVVKDQCNHNGNCDAGETPTTCSDDCPANMCNNNTVCDNGETTVSCPQDCPTTVCGNGKCEVGETNANCSKDCSANCNNNTQCDPGETNATCPNDCANVGQTKCDSNGCVTISAQNAPGCNLGDVKLNINFKNPVENAKAYITLYGGRGVKFVSNLPDTNASAMVLGENVSWNLGNITSSKTLSLRVSFDNADPDQLVTYTFGKMQLKYYDPVAKIFQTLPIPDVVLSPTCADSKCNMNGVCDFEAGENYANCAKDCYAYKDEFFVETLVAKDINNGSATLRGTLVSLGNVKGAKVYFQYYKCSDSENMTLISAGELLAPDIFQATISGLEANTEYCYIASAENKDNKYDIVIGNLAKFTNGSDNGNKYACPDVVSPLEDESVTTLTPTLKWNASTGKYFKVALYPNLWNSTTTPTFQSGAISANSVVIPAGKLNWGKKYAWGFLVCADSALTDCNATYCWQKEFAAGTVLKSPTIIKPALNGSSTAIAYTPSTDIEWEFVPNAQIYKYAVSAQGGGIKSTATTTEKTATVMLPAGTYVLSVWACEKSDLVNCSIPSIREFIVKDKDKELSQCSSARFGTATFNATDPLPDTRNRWMTICTGSDTQCASKNIFKEYQISPNYRFFAKDEISGTKYYFGEPLPLPLDKKLLLGADYFDTGLVDITDPLFSGSTGSPAVSILDGLASDAATAKQAITATNEIEGSSFGLVISNPFSGAGAIIEDVSSGGSGSYFEIISENGKTYIKTKTSTGDALIDSPAKIKIMVPSLSTYQTIDNVWFNEGCINGAEQPFEYSLEIKPTEDKCSVEIKDNGVVVKGNGVDCNNCHGFENKEAVGVADGGLNAWSVVPMAGSAIVGSQVECCDKNDQTACVTFDKKYINTEAPGVVNPQFTVDTCKYPAEGLIRWEPSTTTIQKDFNIQICKKVGNDEICPLTINSGSNKTAASAKVYFGYSDNFSANQIAFDSSDPDWFAKVKLCGGVNGTCNDTPAIVSAGKIGAIPKKVPEITVQSIDKEAKKIVFLGEVQSRQVQDAFTVGQMVVPPVAKYWKWYRADTEQALLNASSTSGDVGLKGAISQSKTMDYVDGRQFWIELEFGAEAGGCSYVTSTINGSGVRICSGCGGGSD